jgi:hypothetical protein
VPVPVLEIYYILTNAPSGQSYLFHPFMYGSPAKLHSSLGRTRILIHGEKNKSLDGRKNLGFFKPARAKAAAAGGQLPLTASSGILIGQSGSRKSSNGAF